LSSAVAEVYRASLATADDKQRSAIMRQRRRIRRAVWRFAIMFPIAIPAALFEAAHATATGRGARLARGLFALSAACAERFGMAGASERARGAAGAMPSTRPCRSPYPGVNSHAGGGGKERDDT
jgi:hypothetical protein